ARIGSGQDDQVLAQLPGFPQAHPRAHSITARFVAATGDNAGANRDRPAAQPGIVTLLDRGEEGVDIHMNDGLRHGKPGDSLVSIKLYISILYKGRKVKKPKSRARSKR